MQLYTVCSPTADPWASTSLNYSAFWTRYKFIGLINRAFLWSTWNTEDNLERPFVMKSLHARLARKGRQLKLLIGLWNSEKINGMWHFFRCHCSEIFHGYNWETVKNNNPQEYFFIARYFEFFEREAFGFKFSHVFIQQINRLSSLLRLVIVYHGF